MATLVILDGPEKGKRFEIINPITRVGRNEINDIVIANPSISSYHCEIEKTETGIRIRDLDSTNGTKLNGEPIRSAAMFRNDVVTMGDVPMTLEGDDVPQGTAAAVSAAEITRTTIVIAPRTGARIDTPKEFGKRRDFKLMWFILFGVLAVAIIALGLTFFRAN